MSLSYAPQFNAVTAIAPSNIAFLKYWGKRNSELQWPANNSLSMTLSSCKTVTSAQPSNENFDSFNFNGSTINSLSSPSHKVFNHLNRLRTNLNIKTHLEIESYNTFPAECGIASSASGFAAMTIASAAALLQTATWDELSTLGATRNNLAQWARMGSGSACRSLYGGFVAWMAGPSAQEQKIEQLWTPDYWDLADVIVVISSAGKSVSSTEAHRGAWASPLFSPRIANIDARFRRMRSAIESKDLEFLGEDLEAEALEMHAVSMTGSPQVNYLTNSTTDFITWVRNERRRGQMPAWFTMDAGPNVHLICKRQDAEVVRLRVQQSWDKFSLITDSVGHGPQLLSGRGVTANV